MKIHGTTGSLEVDGILSAEELRELNSSQLNDASAVRGYWQEHGYGEPYPLVIKPTGYGKGRVIDTLLHPNQEPGVALLIVGTKNILVEQNQEALSSLVKEETGASRFSILPDVSGPVIVATWQSLQAYRKRIHTPPTIDLVIVDEVHNIGTRRRLAMLRWLKAEKVVGLTATAYRSHGVFRAPERYGFQPIEEITDTLPACIDRRWLSPLMGLCIDTEVILPRDVMTGDALSGKKLYREMRHHPDLFASIAEEIGTRFLPSGMKTIVVVNRVLEEACVIYKHFERMGFKAGLAVNQNASRMLESSYVTNGSIERYKLPNSDPDSIQVLISPQVIGEGFDAPATECVVWASPTHSSLRYTQVMGRGARRCPGKAYCLIVDFVYQIEGYGYSMNFAQFFKQKEIKELEGGFMYVGPGEGQLSTNMPYQFTKDAKVVSIVDLRRRIIEPAGDWLVKGQVQELLGKSHWWVVSQLAILGIESEERLDRVGRPQPHYHPSCVELLRSRLPILRQAGDWIPVANLAAEVGKSRGWIVSTLERLGIASERRISSTSREYDYYPPNVVDILQTEAAQYQLAGDWLPALRIAELVRRSHKWVVPELEKLGIKPEERWASNGHLNTYYPPSAAKLLAEAVDAIPEKGDYVTIGEATSILGVDKKFLKTLLNQLAIKGEDRWSQGQERRHLSPSDIARLREALDARVMQSDFLSLVELASKVGRSRWWCKQNLEQIGEKAEKRWTLKSGFQPCYSPTIVATLQQLAQRFPKANGWVTLKDISAAIGTSPTWVEPRLRAELAETRLSKTGGKLSHYPPSVIRTLKSELDSVPPAGDWKTVGAIASELGVANSWVVARLKPFRDQIQVRRAMDRRMFEHYPPEVFQTLQELHEQYKKSRK